MSKTEGPKYIKPLIISVFWEEQKVSLTVGKSLNTDI